MGWVRFTVSEQSQSPGLPARVGTELATLQLPKPRNPMSWAMGSGHLATCPIQAKRTCTYRRTVPEHEGTSVSGYTQVPLPTAEGDDSSPQRYQYQVSRLSDRRATCISSGPSRSSEVPSTHAQAPWAAINCCVLYSGARCQTQRRGGAGTRSHTVFLTVAKVPPVGPCPWAKPLSPGWQQRAARKHAAERSRAQQLTSSCKSEIKSHRFLRAQRRPLLLVQVHLAYTGITDHRQYSAWYPSVLSLFCNLTQCPSFQPNPRAAYYLFHQGAIPFPDSRS